MSQPMGSHYTSNCHSQLPPMDTLFITVPPNPLFSLRFPLLCSPDLPVVCYNLDVRNCISSANLNKVIFVGKITGYFIFNIDTGH